MLGACRPGHCGKAAVARRRSEGNHPPADNWCGSCGSICGINISEGSSRGDELLLNESGGAPHAETQQGNK